MLIGVEKSVIRFGLCICALFLMTNGIAGDNDCGKLKNHYGPFDYNSAPESQRDLVEQHHFTSNVERLKRGSTGTIAGDIDYTLSVFPNHPRALYAMSNLALRERTARVADSRYSVDCWFERAFRFRSNDPMPRMIYGIYLLKSGKTKEAISSLEMAADIHSDDGNINYNLGLAYFESKQYEKALERAHLAERQGFRLPGLKNKLVKAGMWRDDKPAN